MIERIGTGTRPRTARRTPLACESSRTDTENSTENETISIRRKKANGAPVIDSVLLQFISQQQNIPEVFREEKVAEAFNISTTTEDDNNYSTEEEQNYASTTDAIKRKLTDGSFAKSLETEQDPAPENTAPSLSSSWMIQFSSKKVAEALLEEAGVDVAMAQTAGDAVERYCVVRTARRRIRRFLKTRDHLWASTTNPGVEGGNPSYGFADVLEVLKDYGLTGSDLCVLLTHSPNLALRVPRKSFLRQGETDNAETLEETLDRSLKGLLMERLNLRRYDARKVLRTCPGLLSVRGSKSAVQVLTIMTKLGLSESSLARDKNSLPVLLSRSPAGLFRLVAFLSSTAVRMPMDKIGPLLRNRSGRELMDTLVPALREPANTDETAASSEEDADESTTTTTTTTTLDDDAAAWSRTRMQRQERIERTYANMAKTASLLRFQMGTNDLSPVISAYPSVLLLDSEKQILPVARYMMGGLGIWKDDLSSVLKLYPTLLGKSIEELEKIVSYVLTLGVEEDELAGIFRAFPGLFALEIHEMQAVVDYLKSIGVRDVGSFVTKLPPVLGYSVDADLKPKWEFLKTVCLQPEFELQQFPAYFSYPFGRVIKTRFNYLAYKGISIRFVSMRIDTVLRFGDADFANKVALDDDGGEEFRKFGKQGKSRSANGAAAAQNRSPANSKKYRRNNRDKHFRRKNYNKSKTNNAATSKFEKRYMNKKNYKSNGNSNSNRNNNGANSNRPRSNEESPKAESMLDAAKRLSKDSASPKDLAELNKSFREAMPLRNRKPRSQAKPQQPKPTKGTKQNEERSDGGEDGAWPVTA
eukprot:jgi/Psemu1/259456/estExt_Genewise1Plus.C_3540036